MKQETRNSTRIKEKKLTGKKIQRKIQKQLETKRNSNIELAKKTNKKTTTTENNKQQTSGHIARESDKNEQTNKKYSHKQMATQKD